MEQPEYNLFERQKVEVDYLPIYEKYGLGTTIWSPLASGRLTGKYNEGIPKGSRADLKNFSWIKEKIESAAGQAQIARVKKLAVFANTLGLSVADLSLAWCLKNENVSTVILGASRVEQLQANLLALDAVSKLDAPLMAEIESIMQTKPVKPEIF